MSSSKHSPDASEESSQGDPAQNLLHATSDFLVGVKTQAGDDHESAPSAGAATSDGSETVAESTMQQTDPAIVEPPDPGFVVPAG